MALCSTAQSQTPVFNEVYDYGNNMFEAVSFLAELPNSANSIVLSSYVPLFSSSYQSKLRVSIINELGYIEEDKIYSFNNYTEIGTGIHFDDNYIYILGVTRDSTEDLSFDSFILKLTYDLDSVYSNTIDIGFNDGGHKLNKIAENKLIYLSYVYSDSTILENSQVVMVTIDTLGNVLDEWEFGGPSYDFAYDYKITADKGYIIGGTTKDSILDDGDLFLLKLDSLGNQEWYQEYGTLNNEDVRTWNYIEITDDGDYLMIGEERLYTPNWNPQGVVLKVASNGTLLWRENFQQSDSSFYTFPSSIRIWSDESIIISGVSAIEDSIPYDAPRGFIVKFSSDMQTVIWKRWFSKWWIDDTPNSPSQSSDYVHDMVLTNDGGILVGGYQIHPFITRNDAWLVKFDSCGYTVGDIPTPFFVVDSLKRTNENNTVFLTEQSQDYCTAEIDWGDGTELQHYYAYENNQPLQEKQFQHSYTENGLYTIKTTTLSGEEYRSYEVEVDVRGISVGISNVIPAQAGISLYPNPANDFIIIQNPYATIIATPNTSAEAICSNPADCFFVPHRNDALKMSIYTINGEQVESKNLNTKLYQQKLDITSLNNGVYVVKFEIDGMLVGTEKLVIAR